MSNYPLRYTISATWRDESGTELDCSTAEVIGDDYLHVTWATRGEAQGVANQLQQDIASGDVDLHETTVYRVEEIDDAHYCPHCGRENAAAEDDGAVEGPREYHAECWDKASANMTDEEIGRAWNESPLDV